MRHQTGSFLDHITRATPAHYIYKELPHNARKPTAPTNYDHRGYQRSRLLLKTRETLSAAI